jgi:predicted PhzF superfamily epimerase YddE/YHI9
VKVREIGHLPAFNSADICEVCRVHSCNAVVFFEDLEKSIVRTRVFTTSLGGSEDIATGGAAAGIGALLADMQKKGRIEIIQGPPPPSTQGHILLWLDQQRHVGGRVRTLLTGKTARR